MKRLRWQFLIVVLSLITIGLLLLGEKPDTLPTIEPVKEIPKSGGIYTEALIGSPGRLNPLLDWYNDADREIDRLIFDSLIRFDDHGLPKGDLADSWGISQDGKTYNFLLREAYWHDGQPVTSEDVVYTANLLQNEALPFPEDFRQFWSQVEIEALDEKVVQFRLPEAFTPFMDYLSFGILPKHIWSNTPPEQFINSPLNLNPIGNGPFKFKKFITEDRTIIGVELEQNNNYFGKIPYLEKVNFKYYPDALSSIQAYEDSTSNEEGINGISKIPPENLDKAFDQSQLNIYTSLIPKLNLLLFNINETGPSALQDINVRQGLFLGLNRQWIMDNLLQGQAVQADGPIFPASWAYYQDLPSVAYDPDKAINLLKDAGYTIPAEGGDVRVKESNRLEFELIYPESPPYPEIAKAVQQDWKKLGVIINLKSVPPTEIIRSYLEPRNYEIALVELDGMRAPDPDPYPFWHQTQITRGQNYSGWNDRIASEYLEQARTIVETDERTRLYKNFQFRFMNQLPSLPLFYPTQAFGVGQDIHGVLVGPLFDYPDRFNSISEWFFPGSR
jgi:peptide/nickel transport system substrate-binding protein